MNDAKLTERGFAIADQASWELVRSESVIANDGDTFIPLCEKGTPVMQVGELGPVLTEAIRWLEDRSLAAVKSEPDGIGLEVVPLNEEKDIVEPSKVLVVPAHPTREDADGPAFAIFRLDQAFMDKVSAIQKRMAAENDLLVITRHLIQWDKPRGRQLGSYGLAVTLNHFWFTADLVFADYGAETIKLLVGVLSRYMNDKREIIYFNKGAGSGLIESDNDSLRKLAEPAVNKFIRGTAR